MTKRGLKDTDRSQPVNIGTVAWLLRC